MPQEIASNLRTISQGGYALRGACQQVEKYAILIPSLYYFLRFKIVTPYMETINTGMG